MSRGPGKEKKHTEKDRRDLLPVIFCVLFVLASGLYHLLNVRDACLQTGDGLPMKLYAALFPAGLAASAAAGFLFRKKNIPLHRLFFAAGLFLGLMFLFVMPGLSAPDEQSHYITAYRLSSRMLGEPDLTPAGLAAVRADDYPLEDLEGVKTPEIWDDAEDAPAVLGVPVRNATYRAVRDWDARYPHKDGTVSSALPDVRTTPAMYVPQAAGFAAARAAGLNAPGLVFAGRFMNLLAFLLLTAFAVRLMPFGKELLCAVGLLPMTLHLAASLSYDAGILGCSFLMTAEILRLAYRADRVRARDVALLAALAAILGPCKLVYSPLVFLFFIIPAKKCGGKGRKAAYFAVIFAALSAAMVLVNASVIRGYAGAQGAAAEAQQAAEAAGAAAAEAAVRGYPAGELIRQPFFIARMVFNTFSFQSDELFGGMMGMWLGNLDPLLGVPFFAALLMFLGLLLLTLRQPEETQPMSGPARAWTLLIAAGTVLLTAGAMLVAWTTRGAQIIEGIQGRYFLPVLPLFLLPLRNSWIRLERNLGRTVLAMLFCMDVYVLLRVFALAAMRL